jgi:Tol biopolymer transport system component
MAYLVHWSRDDSTLYLKMGQNLHKLDIASGTISKLTNFEETQLVDRGFNVSPDETRLVYADYKNEQSDLFISELDGSNPVQLTNDSARDSGPVWFPDGKHVVYNSDRNGVSQIVMASANGVEPVQLTLGDNDTALADVSSDGGKILYTTAKDDSDIWAIHLNGGSEFQLTADIGAEFWPAISPRGDAVVYQASKRMSVGARLRESTIFAQPIAPDAKPKELSPKGFSPIWSPDGNSIAFFTPERDSNSIWVMSTAGGDARKVTADGVMFGGYSSIPYNRLQTQDLQWSADSTSIMFSARREGKFNIWSVSRDGQNERMLTANEDRSLVYLNPAASPDGSKIAWTAFDFSNPATRTWSVWVAANGQQRQVYRSESALRLIGWSASGDGLIVKAVDRSKDSSPLPLEVDVFQVHLDGEPPLEIAALKDCYFANVTLSPDRQMLAFVARDQDRDAVQVLPLATRRLRTVAVSNDPRVYLSGLTFSPDGQTLFYGKQANWQVISMIKGVN